MPLDVSVKIGTEESVRTLLEITERMDYRELYASYGRETKAEEVTPKQMFQLVILGFMTHAYSTRALESACRNDIRFMYILGGKTAPDHDRFWRFILKHLQGDVAWLEVMLGAKAARGIAFVHGRGKRKTQLQRDTQALQAYQSRKEKYADYSQAFRGRNSFSKTDRDATFMRMKDDHMKNGQLKPGYNLQLAVEGEYIVGLDISSERSDQNTLLSLLDRIAKGNGGKRHTCVVADAGYESDENYLGVRNRGQIAYIKPQNYEKSKTRKYRTNAYLRENMHYDAAADSYTCPAGKTFTHIYDTVRRSKSGFEAALSVYECQGCQGCPQKKLCTRAKGNRRLTLSRQFVALRQQALERITSEKGKLLRMNRSIQSEGAFGILKQDYGFRRFLRRGGMGVFTETLLYAIAYNLDKLHGKLMRDKTGCTLHKLNSA